ncbi:DUF4148 domain-containing protein [Variovorax robiniae]|uniref:DUF4148 domain-containing protein n=1 Tax=Variovorax robiniae TaxID=1836199 RepID=A0ABU8X8B1_9BURK
MKHQAIALSILAGAAVAVPFAAFAAGPYHPAPGEAGVTYVPEHDKRENSRQQVVADLEKAQKQPAWNAASRGAPWPVAKTGAPKTRDDVSKEAANAMRAGTIPSGER